MTRDQVIALIGKRIGNRSNLDSSILLEMDLCQATTLERNGRIIPWFLETEEATASLSPSDQRVAVPADFAREKEEGGLFWYDPSAATSARWKKLEKAGFDFLRIKYQEETGDPKAYSLGGLYFRVFPKVVADKTLKMIYFASDVAPSAIVGGGLGTNLWLTHAPDLMIAEVSRVMAEKYVEDFELAATFNPDIIRAWERLNMETESRQHDNREYSMGDN